MEVFFFPRSAFTLRLWNKQSQIMTWSTRVGGNKEEQQMSSLFDSRQQCGFTASCLSSLWSRLKYFNFTIGLPWKCAQMWTKARIPDPNSGRAGPGSEFSVTDIYNTSVCSQDEQLTADDFCFRMDGDYFWSCARLVIIFWIRLTDVPV